MTISMTPAARWKGKAKQRPSYSPEFRREAVQMVLDGHTEIIWALTGK